jgi:hypothetical protein
MISPLEMNDAELLEQLENCTLSPSFFTHEVMLRLSWILIQKYGIKEAITKNCEIKENYFNKVIAGYKFNLPLTKAYTEILYFFMEKSSAKDLNKLLREFPRLRFNFKDLVKTHYGYDILKEHRTEEPQTTGRPILFTF